MEIAVDIRSYRYGKEKKDLFKDMSFTISEPGFYLITGLSGIGKSSLLRILLGEYEGKMNGSVCYKLENKSYTSNDMKERGMIGYQPDDFSLIPWKTVKENIQLPAILNKHFHQISDNKIEEEIAALRLEPDITGKYPHELSFGMKARVGLIRACLWNPPIIFIDELFSGIDSVSICSMSEYLHQKSKSAIIIAISHQVEPASKIACETIILNSDRTLKKFKKANSETIIRHLIEAK